MNPKHIFLPILCLLLAACAASSSSQLPVSEMPDPAIYAITLSELPDVGLTWQETYNQTQVEQDHKWSYRAYQAYQPGNLGVELESGFAINNDVAIYQQIIRKGELPQPPSTLGSIQDISWKSVTPSRKLGDQSAMWKTALGELMTPAWWLEFTQGHTYVRLSLLGFPDQIAPSILLGMGDIIASRLPRSVDQLRLDSATAAPTNSPYPPTVTPGFSPFTVTIEPNPPSQTPQP